MSETPEKSDFKRFKFVSSSLGQEFFIMTDKPSTMAKLIGDEVYIDWAMVEVAANSADTLAFDYGIAKFLLAARDKTWKDVASSPPLQSVAVTITE